MRPNTYVASDHDIDPAQVDSDALYVLQKLKKAGHTAYLVGGSVRDLLIKIPPKDFDISTSASPEEIKGLFRRQCILIGKRFRLAHIRMGHKIFEVSTFRSGDNESDLIIRDNTWGTEEEDVIRRDFTINGLFYDPSTRTVIDYVGGWEDIHKRLLRTIGDPYTRFKQDPVRMIRLLKFRARFRFDIEEATKKALLACKEEIVKSAPARILEELFRMLESGASAPFFQLMTQSKMLYLIFPALAAFLEEPKGDKIYRLLSIADQINKINRKNPIERPVLSSCLLFPLLEEELEKSYLSKGNTPHLGDVVVSVSNLVRDVVTFSFTHFPRRISTAMISLMTDQYRMTPFSGKRHYRQKFLRSKEFPQALKFLKIRAAADNNLLEAYNSWKNIHRQYWQHTMRKEHPHHPPPEQE